jgi:hypothetical protein
MKRGSAFNRLNDEPFSSTPTNQSFAPSFRSDTTTDTLIAEGNDDRELIRAVQLGDTFLLQKVLDDGIDVNTADSEA